MEKKEEERGVDGRGGLVCTGHYLKTESHFNSSEIDFTNFFCCIAIENIKQITFCSIKK